LILNKNINFNYVFIKFLFTVQSLNDTNVQLLNIFMRDNKLTMINWAKDLFPICRSITGEGTRKTLTYFEKLNPEFKRLKFKTGQKVFDWIIPKEWNIKNAYIEHSSGTRFAEFNKCNLHIVGYSKPINRNISKKELLNYIYTQKDQPNSIPYVTSYYKERWGFCLSENQKNKLPDGNYKVFIDSSFKKGNLDISHAILKGMTKKEIFFSSYVCHPSMANNELSGPVLLNAIMLYIKSNYPKSKLTYRFVLLPETIGSIAYLSKFLKVMKSNIVCGFNLTCVGDERTYSYVSSRKGDTIADYAIKTALLDLPNVKKYSFLDRSSDERQYCSPGIDLPLCAFSRSRKYPEYHTNKDNFDVVTQEGLMGSFKVMKKIVDVLELGIYPKTTTFAEPSLSKKGLYTTLSQKGKYDDARWLRMNLIAYSDGKTNIFKIAELLNEPLDNLCKEYSILKSKKILK